MFNFTPMVQLVDCQRCSVFYKSSHRNILRFFNPVLPLDEGGYTINPWPWVFWQPFTYALHGGMGHIFSVTITISV
jgi:hypothetical protein